MKISLNMNNGSQSTKEAQAKILERDVMAARKGDWNAKNNLVRTFMPLLRSLAEKRSGSTADANRLIEAGKGGLFLASRKHSPGDERFQIFAVEFIEKAMDHELKLMHDEQIPRRIGFLARLFRRS
jgi:DNA-directed RNA polymerase specialized sigma subunit